jgi:hypothetical protein
MVVWNVMAKNVIFFEVSCQFAKVYENGHPLAMTYDHKVAKHARRCEAIRLEHPSITVSQVAIIVSSLGAAHEESLK